MGRSQMVHSMFLRFGFVLGQAGVLGMLGLLAVSYVIDLITTLSVSAISSNGTVKGGGVSEGFYTQYMCGTD